MIVCFRSLFLNEASESVHSQLDHMMRVVGLACPCVASLSQRSETLGQANDSWIESNSPPPHLVFKKMSESEAYFVVLESECGAAFR